MGHYHKLAVFAALLLSAACATAPSSGPAPVKPGGKSGAVAIPAAPVFLLSDLLGAGAGKVDALFGSPALTRREGNGEYRRYGLKQCSLIVILYPDDKGAPKVAHVDATAHDSGQEKPDLDQCLAAG